MTLVAGQQTNERDRARKRRDGVAIGASVFVHVIVLAIIGLNIPRPVYREPPPVQTTNIWLMPRLTPEQHKPAEHRAAAARQLIAPAPPKVVKPSPAPAPIQSAAAPGRAPPSGQKPAPAPTNVGVDGGQGVRDALRTSVGCDADRVVHLAPGERDRCSEKVGEMAKKAPVFSGIDPLKRGRFDEQAAADERRRADREGPMQEVMPACTGPGSNLGGACLPDSASAHVHQH